MVRCEPFFSLLVGMPPQRIGKRVPSRCNSLLEGHFVSLFGYYSQKKSLSDPKEPFPPSLLKAGSSLFARSGLECAVSYGALAFD